MSKAPKFLSWVYLVLWCSLIFYLSNIPDLKTNLGVWDLILRKIAHMTEYAVLFLLSIRSFKGTWQFRETGDLVIAAFLFSVLYACSDEYHQTFIAGRCGCPQDVGLDTIGVFFGYLAARIQIKKG